MNPNPVGKGKSRKSPSVGKPVPCGNGGDCTVTIRKIANGYIVRESTYTGRTFKEKETYCETAPKLGMEPKKRGS